MIYQVKGFSGYVLGVCRCMQVSAGVCGYAWVCTGVRGYARVCACVWNEFSEFLLENRVPTSADFNTYPIQIFSLQNLNHAGTKMKIIDYVPMSAKNVNIAHFFKKFT